MPAAFSGDNLPFPGSLPEFQRLFPNDAACATYLEAIRWRSGFFVWLVRRAGRALSLRQPPTRSPMPQMSER